MISSPLCLTAVPLLRCSCGSKKKKTNNTIIPECSATTTWMGTKHTRALKELMVLVKWSLHDSTARWWLVDKVTHSSRLRQPIKCWVMFLLVQNWPFVFSEILLSDLKALWLKNSTTWLAHILIKFGFFFFLELPDNFLTLERVYIELSLLRIDVSNYKAKGQSLLLQTGCE